MANDAFHSIDAHSYMSGSLALPATFRFATAVAARPSAHTHTHTLGRLQTSIEWQLSQGLLLSAAVARLRNAGGT